MKYLLLALFALGAVACEPLEPIDLPEEVLTPETEVAEGELSGPYDLSAIATYHQWLYAQDIEQAFLQTGNGYKVDRASLWMCPDPWMSPQVDVDLTLTAADPVTNPDVKVIFNRTSATKAEVKVTIGTTVVANETVFFTGTYSEADDAITAGCNDTCWGAHTWAGGTVTASIRPRGGKEQLSYEWRLLIAQNGEHLVALNLTPSTHFAHKGRGNTGTFYGYEPDLAPSHAVWHVDAAEPSGFRPVTYYSYQVGELPNNPVVHTFTADCELRDNNDSDKF